MFKCASQISSICGISRTLLKVYQFGHAFTAQRRNTQYNCFQNSYKLEKLEI